MKDEEETGFTYYVSDEQLARFAKASIDQRLDWLEDMREATYALASPETRLSWARLRGKPFGR